MLSDFSLEVREAETKVILGGSGSGKSTLLKMVLGLVKPDAGRVMVQGVDVSRLSETKLSPIRRQIGMVFQESALFDFLTVGENVAYRMREDGELPISEIESTLTMTSCGGLEVSNRPQSDQFWAPTPVQ